MVVMRSRSFSSSFKRKSSINRRSTAAPNCKRRRCHSHSHSSRRNLSVVTQLSVFVFLIIVVIAVLATPSTTIFGGRRRNVLFVESIMMDQNNNIKNKKKTHVPDKSRFVYGKDDALFGAIEELQRQEHQHQHELDDDNGNSSTMTTIPSFGHILDAGTGVHSIRWIATLVHRDDDQQDEEDDDENDTDTDNQEQPKAQSPHQSAAATSTTRNRFTAITADTTMQRNVQDEVDALGITDKVQVIVGNWFPSVTTTSGSSTGTGTGTGTATTQTHGSTSSLDLWLDDENGYDTILADYLVGAMDGFSPYQQDRMIPLLAKYLKPGGILYIVGLQPLPDKVDSTTKDVLSGDGTEADPETVDAANIICRVRQVRDACILLAGHRCYREYPLEWIERQIQNEPSLELVSDGAGQTFPILYRYTTIQKQINVARSKLKFFKSQTLASEMSKTLDDLDQQAKRACDRIPGNRIRLGFDYVVAARKKKKKNSSDGETNHGEETDDRKEEL